MNILIISKEAWRNEQNGGNVLSNIFCDFDANFAQIYCTDCSPNNTICKKYYQLTDKMMINSIVNHKKAGKILEYDEVPCYTEITKEGYSFVKKFNSELVREIREFVWNTAKWNEDEILDFVGEFKPDIIFAPCYGTRYMYKLNMLIFNNFNVPIVSYISDDMYSNKRFRFSPLFWIGHAKLRKCIKSLFSRYSLIYTMTDEQKSEYEKYFGKKIKILRKGCKSKEFENKEVNNPIRLIYAGNMIYGRWKTIVGLANAVRKVNVQQKRVVFDIYSGTELKKRIFKKIHDGEIVRINPIIDLKELENQYKKSDIILNIEGFDLKSRLLVRLSFSTKIVDCLNSGCAVMAICSPDQAGHRYLKKNDAAICIEDMNEIESKLIEIVNNQNTILEYRKKAYTLAQKNHNMDNINDMLKDDFNTLINKNFTN